MSAANTIGFGIVGTGMIANYHAKAIKALSEKLDIHLMGALDSSLDRARDFAQKNDVPFYTDSAEAFFANPAIQVVCITTPSGAHLEPALLAIHAGKHLIVEKPLEITVERVDAMLAAAHRAQVKVAAIFQARLSRGAAALKQAIDAGRFGRLSLCSAYIKWHRSEAYYTGWKGTLKMDGGGAVMNQAIHAVDLLQWLVGMPTDVFAFKTRRVHLGIEAEDTACATLRFGCGALGTIEATTAAYPGWERRIEICGEFGCAAIEDDRIVRWDFRHPTPADDALLGAPDNASSGSGAGAPDQINFDGHLRQIEDMVLSLRNGTPLLIDGAQARNTVALVRAIYASAESGSQVKLSA